LPICHKIYQCLYFITLSYFSTLLTNIDCTFTDHLSVNFYFTPSFFYFLSLSAQFLLYQPTLFVLPKFQCVHLYFAPSSQHLWPLSAHLTLYLPSIFCQITIRYVGVSVCISLLFYTFQPYQPTLYTLFVSSYVFVSILISPLLPYIFSFIGPCYTLSAHALLFQPTCYFSGPFSKS
jgi:hypothetical protein